jgi:hypothetical protein
MRFYSRAMTFLLINLLVLAAVAATVVFAYAQVQHAAAADDGPQASIDYHALQAHWREQGQVRDWEGLRAQVRRWQQIAAPGNTQAQSEQVARDLNAAVFRFAVPGEPPTFGDGAGAGHRDSRSCPAKRRTRSVRWPAW